jgi:hypothetical protein
MSADWEEHSRFFPWPAITRNIKSRGRMVGKVRCRGEEECLEESGKPEGWRPLERPSPRWRIILKFIIKI